MFNGLTFEKLMLILVIAAFLLGPERLPRYAEALAGLVRRVRDFAQGARTRMKDEMGDEFDDVDWRQLDPRQYDPRRIIREALLDGSRREGRESHDDSGSGGEARHEQTRARHAAALRQRSDLRAGSYRRHRAGIGGA